MSGAGKGTRPEVRGKWSYYGGSKGRKDIGWAISLMSRETQGRVPGL